MEMVWVFFLNLIVRKDGIVYGLDGFMVLLEVVLVFEEWKSIGKGSVKFCGFLRKSSVVR